jgi:uncharacterized protein (TIGR02145 family)
MKGKKLFTVLTVLVCAFVFAGCEKEKEENAPTTTYLPGEVRTGSGGVLKFMTYNLGASPNMTIAQQIAYTPSSDADATVYGDLYQWGRNTDGHEKRTSETTARLSYADIPGHGNFIMSDDYYWRSPWNNSLWGAIKTPNDPCPAGYRIPTKAEWMNIYDTSSGNIWEWTGNGYRVSPDGGATWTLFLPAAGKSIAGGNVCYWSVSVGINSYNPDFPWVFPPSGGHNSYSAPAIGMSCRCVQE